MLTLLVKNYYGKCPMRHNTPSISTSTIYAVIAILIYAGSKAYPLPDWAVLAVRLASGALMVYSFVILVNWLLYEYTKRWRDLLVARVAPATAMSDALYGHDAKSREYIANQVYMDFEGIGEPLVIWRLRMPTGKHVDVGLIREFLQASKERGDGHLYPVRNHDDSRFDDFVNVEEQLKILVHEFNRRGWCDRAVGPNPARLRVPLDIIESSLFGQVIGL